MAVLRIPARFKAGQGFILMHEDALDNRPAGCHAVLVKIGRNLAGFCWVTGPDSLDILLQVADPITFDVPRPCFGPACTWSVTAFPVETLPVGVYQVTQPPFPNS